MRAPVLCTIEHLFLPCLDRPSYSTHTCPQKSRAYTRTRLVPSRADRPYGAFPRGHHEVAPDPGVQHPPERMRIRTALRRVLPWTAALAAPALLVAISMAPAPREADIQPSPTPTPLTSEVYAKVAPSVVQIKALSSDGKLVSSGSGVVIDDAGDILTALHVVQDAASLSVVFADGTESAAVIISEVAASDIAALRPANTPAQLTPATLGNPSGLRIGDDAIVVGNPVKQARSACRRTKRSERLMAEVQQAVPPDTGRLLFEIKKVIVGQDHLIERLMVGLLARGHLLVEGVPGLAKTLSVKTVAQAITGDFKRIQFTPDLVPADLVGTRI